MRAATRQDIQAIVAMLEDDDLGRTRESASDPALQSASGCYLAAFDAIEADTNNTVYVSELDGEIVATLQLTRIPNLTYQGGWRMQIEAVRVARNHRGSGIGEAMIRWAIQQARDSGCVLVQLTTDRRRRSALAFYRGLGFHDSHSGMKLWL